MSSTAFGPAATNPPAPRWGFWFWLKIVLGGWVLAFVIVVVPLTLLNSWKVSRLPVVEGTLSNQRIVEVENRKARMAELWVKATLQFDRPSESGIVHCRHDDVTIGPAGKPESFVTRAQLAVRRDSCHDYSFLPVHVPSWMEWAGIFLAVGIYLIFLTGILYFALRYQKPGAARSAASPPPCR